MTMQQPQARRRHRLETRPDQPMLYGTQPTGGHNAHTTGKLRLQAAAVRGCNKHLMRTAGVSNITMMDWRILPQLPVALVPGGARRSGIDMGKKEAREFVLRTCHGRMGSRLSATRRTRRGSVQSCVFEQTGRG